MDKEIKTPNPQVKEESKKAPIRQVIIETDGNGIRFVKAEVAGVIELKAILETALKALEKGPQP